ncbi:conserved hypothetical protein [Sporisorium reilianum SRZ2]|uniref:Uncharacterized protein n=1 Tax=Sporisorium reilianum (strain SRZ2) TaxID=999809 RepID=E6ZTA5_SPORE|nr:conserved hypothetical protein [Sporisorium reilianum SRZ2]
MADADKENRSTAPGADAALKLPFSSGNGSSASRSTRAPLNPTPLAFPAEDPDEDRDVLASDGKTLRKKRSALFYPSAGLAAKSNQQPFSRSAAKRDSIMALGSIGYLQHLYTKQGIANRNRPLTKGAMTLAIGPAGEAMLSNNGAQSNDETSFSAATARLSTSNPTGDEDEELEEIPLPPSPKAGSYARPKYLDVARPLEADTQALRAQLIDDLHRLSSAWGLFEWIAQNTAVRSIQQLLSAHPDVSGATSTSRSPDPLELINVATKAIRSVRSYVLALPRRSKVPTTFEPSRRDRFKRQSSFSGVPRPGEAGTPVATRTSEILHRDLPPGTSSERRTSLTIPATGPSLGRRLSSTLGEEEEDHLGILRKAALEMLSALKEMEEKSRIVTLGINGGEANQSITAPPTVGKADDSVPAAGSDPDDSSIIAFADPTSGAGYHYRTDLVLSDFDAERKILQGWLETVDRIIASTSAPSIHINLTGVSSSSGGKQKWLLPGLTTAERVSSFMIDHCETGVGSESASRMDRLVDARDDMEALLPLLSDGYLLCRAFNEVVRRSDKPWGYISLHEMHDLEAEEAALLQKEILRAKQAQEDEAVKFQTRAHRKSISEDASSADDSGIAIKSAEPEPPTTRPGWTFRKSENLRYWAAALKLRHHIQTTATKAVPAAKASTTGPTYGSLGMGKLALHAPRAASESHAASPSSPRRGSSSGSASSSKIDFDPAKVARKEAEWQEMLTTLIVAWIDAVAREQSQS